ncbi:MAG TPA: hypothetical protein VGI24_03920 [Solirubrobacteraceae bacterium]|jgi:hypothetical protein
MIEQRYPSGSIVLKPDAAGQLTAAVISSEFHAIESTQEVRDILDHRRGLREAELAALRDRANPKDVLFVPTVAG